MSIPSARDINPVPENLDGQYAERHFLGRTMPEAVRLFETQFSVHCEDLAHMGVAAFRYYVPAAIQYAESDSAKYDCSVARELLSLLNHRWHDERNELRELRQLFCDYSERAIERLGNMEFEVCFDHRLEHQFRRFQQQLNTDIGQRD